MINNPFKLFKAMYIALDKFYEDNKYEDLLVFISDANPLFYENGSSLDPVVFEDFKKMFKQVDQKKCSDYSFILQYLSNLDSFYGNIRQYFEKISESDFLNILNSL